MSKFLLDSNVFIQAYRMHYPFDVVPGFWNKLLELSKRDIILSIDKVKKEICYSEKQDDLALWCINSVDKEFFVDTSSCIDEYAELANWINSNKHYTQTAKAEFLKTDLADPWLIAYVKKHDYIIVTYELSQPGRKNIIKIPEPCLHFGIKNLSPIQMFRQLGETF